MSVFFTLPNYKHLIKGLSGTLIILLLFVSDNVRAQLASNEGTEFWLAFPSHEHDYNETGEIAYPNMSIFITAKMATSGRVIVGSFVKPFSVAANGIAEIQVPYNLAYIDITESGKVIGNKSIYVTVNDGEPPIVVFAHIFAAQRSAASLILPKQTLGSHYFSMNFKPSSNGKSFITVIATQSGTKVHFRKNDKELIKNGILLEHAGDVYQYISSDDLTGVSVEAAENCNAIAVFAGTTASLINYEGKCESKTLDPLYQQVYPIESWGTDYGFVPFSNSSRNFNHPVRKAGQYLRVLASENDTHLYIDGTLIATVDKGDYFTSDNPISQPAHISADKPVCVGQYALSQSCSNLGNGTNYSDPDMVLLNPLQYSINNITVFSSEKENIAEKYINILIKTEAAGSFKVNGTVPTVSFTPMSTLPGYSYLQLDLTKSSVNVFNLRADDGFNAIAYGFGSVESYAYSAGTNLAASQSLSAIDSNNGKIINSACINADYFFRITLPYAAENLTWKMDAAEAPIIQANPHATIKKINGRTVYQYDLPKTQAYSVIGRHQIIVTVSSPSLECIKKREQEIKGSFLVNELPLAKININRSSCENIVVFSDSNDPKDLSIQRKWDFGDKNDNPTDYQSDQAIPIHKYLNAGTYNVKLTITNGSGCISSTTVPMQVNANYPKVEFKNLGVVCYDSESFELTQGVELNNIEGTDGYSGKGVFNNRWFSPAGAGAGSHLITYKFVSRTGCIDSATQVINVEALPEITLPEKLTVIRGQPLILRPKVTGSDLKYAWSPSIGLNDSNIKNPTLTPSTDISYTLTVTGNACSASKTISVKILEPIETFNTFTPNNDGINDTWTIKGIEQYPKATVAIYNRLGSLLFFSEGYSKPWTGQNNNKLLPAGTYYYIINLGNDFDKLSGYVTILR